jgi:hypothetical protein
MFKEIILCCLLIICLSSCANQQKASDKQCNSIHNGVFAFTAKSKSEIVPFTIFRNEAEQIEVQGKDTSTYAVVWIQPCQYELLLKSTNAKLNNEQVQIAKTIPMQCKITAINQNIISFEAERKANRFFLKDTMYLYPTY